MQTFFKTNFKKKIEKQFFRDNNSQYIILDTVYFQSPDVPYINSL